MSLLEKKITWVELCLDPSIKIYCGFTVDKGEKKKTHKKIHKTRVKTHNYKTHNFAPESREESETKYYSAKGKENGSYRLSFLPLLTKIT